jgi:hypothetical protein
MGRPKKTKPIPGAESVPEQWERAAAQANGQQRIAVPDDETRARVDEELPTPLTPTGLLHAAQKQAHAQRTLERLDTELEAFKAGQVQERAQAKKDRTQYAREVESGSAWMLTPCVEIRRYRTNEVLLYVVDEMAPDGLGKLVRSRTMTADEFNNSPFRVVVEDGGRVDVAPGDLD